MAAAYSSSALCIREMSELFFDRHRSPGHHDHGRGTVRLGAEELTEDWRMKQEKKSPCYTTRVDQVVTVR